MRKEIADLIHEAMEQHELARDFYHRLADEGETREIQPFSDAVTVCMGLKNGGPLGHVLYPLSLAAATPCRGE